MCVLTLALLSVFEGMTFIVINDHKWVTKYLFNINIYMLLLFLLSPQ